MFGEFMQFREWAVILRHSGAFHVSINGIVSEKMMGHDFQA